MPMSPDDRSGHLLASTAGRDGEDQTGASASPSGHSRAEPFGLGPTAECPSRGWQPIATAPKDGSEFLAACDRCADGFQQVVFWDDGVAHPGWGVKDSDTICPSGFFTHWRPLPVLPETPDESALRTLQDAGEVRHG